MKVSFALSIVILLSNLVFNQPLQSSESIGDGKLATKVYLHFPGSIAIDSKGNLFVVERLANRVRRIDAKTGLLTTVFGTGVKGFSGDGGLTTQATTNYPKIIFDKKGNLLVAEVNNYRIRRINAKTGIITTIVGNGTQGYSGDGDLATKASISSPFAMAVDSLNNLYIADTENHVIRKVDAKTGVISTVVGNGKMDFTGHNGLATQASLARPHIIAIDKNDNLLIGDSFNQRIRKVDRKTGIIKTIAGSGLRGSSGDGGLATNASFVFFRRIERVTFGRFSICRFRHSSCSSNKYEDGNN